MDIHDRIKHRRRQLGLSHTKLAERISELEGLKTPLSRATVQQWEKKTSAPKRARLPFVAQALEISVEDLMGLDSEHGAPPKLGEKVPAYAVPAWPFQVITKEQIAQLTSSHLAALERLMVGYLIQPTPKDWRTVALEVAADADRLNRDDQFTTFVRSVDLKMRELAAAEMQPPLAAPTS